MTTQNQTNNNSIPIQSSSTSQLLKKRKFDEADFDDLAQESNYLINIIKFFINLYYFTQCLRINSFKKKLFMY